MERLELRQVFMLYLSAAKIIKPLNKVNDSTLATPTGPH